VDRERDCTRVIRTESKVDCNAVLRCVMEVDSSFRGVLVISVHDHADSTEWCESEVPVRV